MIISKNIQIKISRKTITHFRKLGYNIKLNDVINIKPSELSNGSHILIDVKCDVCGSEKSIMYQKYIKNINNSDFYACSPKCAQEKVKKTSIEKFGTEYYTQTNSYKKSVEKTSLKNYGTKHHTQSDIVKNKAIKTNIKKYGVDNPSKSKIIKDKIKNTFLEKYGVDNISKLDFIKDIISEKVTLNIDDTLIKTKNTLLKRYGVDNASKLDFVKKKIKDNNIKKFGVENVLLLDINRKKAMQSKLTIWSNIKKTKDNNIIDIKLNEKLTSIKL